MLELADLFDRQKVFWFCALAGTSLLALQLLLSSVGFDDNDHHHDLDTGKIRWLSKQALTCFLMMFGWTALACERELGLRGSASILIALCVGVFSSLILALIFQWAKKLKSTGTVFRLEEALGKEAMIYHRIPEKGVGKISISLHHMTHEIDARSVDEEEVPSFTTVQVLKIVDDKTVLVVPLKKAR